MRGRRTWATSVAALALLVPGAGLAAGAGGAGPASAGQHAIEASDIVDKPLALDNAAVKAAKRALGPVARSGADAQAAQAEVGDTKVWLAVDFAVGGGLYLKEYTLRGVGEHIEVWVASGTDDVSTGTDFLPGDCRNGVRTQVTDEQVQYLIEEYDTNILPTMTENFSVAPEQNGTQAELDDILELPADYYAGEGDNVVTLVDNVRDENFYDKNLENRETGFVAGFFASDYEFYVDRNVMTIDAWDWLHRTGANPPNDPSSDVCTSSPARPFDYEATFAHEYEHLLMSYEDPEEFSWVDEGLADHAMTLTGYADTDATIFDQTFDGHIQCFLGHLSRETPANPITSQGGPENSLTVWGDQPDDSATCDYGAVYTFMEYLHGLYGGDFMQAFHREDAEGLTGLQNVLDQFAPGTTARELIHRWAAMVALDRVLDDGAELIGGTASDYQAPTLDSYLLWGTPQAYGAPGAPPNGSDYLRFRTPDGGFMNLRDVESIEFEGAPTLPPEPVLWTVDEDPPDHPSAALYSGTGDNFDRSIIREVTVPADDATLTFDTMWDTEPGFDSGFVQVSTDGGETWTSLGNEDTTDELDPGADPNLVNNLPGFNGSSEGWRSESFDLSAYAGQTVLLSFRYISDINTNGTGWWVDDIRLGGELISDGTDVEGWQTLTQINPIPVAGFTVQLVSWNRAHTEAHLATLELDGSFHGSLSRDELRELLGTSAWHVGAIVTYDEPTEGINQYAPYRLWVNGEKLPGGGW